MNPLLEVRDLVVDFPTHGAVVRAVDGISFSIGRDEAVGLVGESGSGKSVTALSILRLLDPPGRIAGGDVLLNGESLIAKTEKEMLHVRGKRISMIFQEPTSSLNPILTIGDQLTEALNIGYYDNWRRGMLPGLWAWALRRFGHSSGGFSNRELKAMSTSLLSDVRIPDPASMLGRYPYTLSGGMMQRVMIAIAMASDAELLIADEPTTALDVTIQAQIMDILRERREASNLAVVLITHDLALVSELCERVIVMYGGRIMEDAPVRALFEAPLHPYSRGLLASVPVLDGGADRLAAIDGSVPDIGKLPRESCPFAWNNRCPLQTEICKSQRPPISRVTKDRNVSCHVYSHPEMKHLKQRLSEIWPPRPEEGHEYVQSNY